MLSHCAVVIPAYNEELTIGGLVDEICPLLSMVIVVNDASTDRTREILEAKPVVLLNQPANTGKAGALMRGFNKAIELNARTIISMDGDAQHDVQDIPRFVELHSRFPDDIIVGARVLNRENAPGIRRFANRFADFWISWAAGQPIRDSQCGYRCFSSYVMENLSIPVSPERGFVFESEFLIEAARSGHRIVTLAIRSCYPDERRKSHFRPLLDVLRITRMVAVKLLSKSLCIQGLYDSLTQKPLHFDR